MVTAVAGVYSIVSDLFLRDRSRVSQRVDDEFRKRQRERAQKSLLFKDLGQLAAEAGRRRGEQPSLRAAVRGDGRAVGPGPDRRSRLLDDRGGRRRWPWGCSAACSARTSWSPARRRRWSARPCRCSTSSCKRNARLEKLLSQLPDAFDLMARVIRAGQTMSQALQAVADEFAQPIAAEFAYCYEQQNLGLPPETALRDLARRTGLLEIKIFVLALLVQQQTGGNLAELLDKLSHDHPRAVPDPGQDQDPDRRGPDAGDRPAGLPPVCSCSCWS